MKIIVTIIAVLVGISVGAYLTDAVVLKEQVRKIDNGSSEPIVSETEAKAEFMTGCDEGTLNGAQFDQTAYCECSFDKIVGTYGVNQLISDGLNLSETQITDKYRTELTDCLKEQGFEL